MSIFTSHLSASNGAQLTGSVRLTEEAAKAASLNFVKDSTNITAGDNLGSVIFSGRDGGPAIPGQDFIIGAAIAATASATWSSNYQQATDLKFWVQSDAVTDNRFDEEAFLTLSGTNGTAQFTGDVVFNNRAIAHNGGQFGISVDGAYADNAGYPVRVSSKTGDVGIELDATNSSATTSLLFNYAGNSASGKPGIFVNPSSNADFSIRNEGTAQENGAIMINSTMNSVRIGGGDFGTDAYDGQAALVVSSSQNNRKSWVMVRSRYGDPTVNNSPVLSFDYNSTAGSENTGAWNIGVSNLTTETSSPKQLPLRISSEGVASSQLLNRAVAMTIAEGGSNTSVGIGGNSSNTWPAGSQLPRSMTPTGSLHIEHMNTTTNQLTADLTKANLLLGNSAAGGTSVFSQLAFDVSSDFNPSKHTANITVSKDQTSSEGHMSFRMYDESGNDSSTRPRIRVDGQGGIIMLSGSNPISAGGWPVVNNANYVVGSSVPSGSLTLLAAKVPGAGGWNAPTLNLVTWGSATHSSPGISHGDSLGRIQWWSSDSELSSESERVGAYIEATASETHDGATFSVADLDFYTRYRGDANPELRLKIASDGTAGFTGDISAGNARLTNIQNQAGQNVMSTDPLNSNAEFSNDVTVGGEITNTTLVLAGDLQLKGHDIMTTDGTVAVTLTDTTGDVTTGGKLKTDFVVSKSTNITLDAVGDIILSADGDNITMDDGQGNTRFEFKLDGTPELDAQDATAKLADVQLYTTAAKERLQKFITDEFNISLQVDNSANQITNGTGTGAARRYLFSNLGAKGDKSTDYRRNSRGFEVRNQSTVLNGSTSSTYKWQPPSTSERFEQYNSMAWVCPADLIITGMTISCRGEHKIRPNKFASTAAADVLVSIARARPTHSYILASNAGTSFLSDNFVNSAGDKLLDGNYGVEIGALEPGTGEYFDLSGIGGSMNTTLTAGSKIYMALKIIWDSPDDIFYEYSQTGDTTQSNGYVDIGYLNYSIRLSGYYV